MKTELIYAIKNLALEVKPEGEFFTLKSGAKSKYYLDLRNLHLTPWGLKIVVDLIAEDWLLQGNIFKFEAFGGPSIGADPIIGGLCYKNLAGAHKQHRGFLIRPEAKDHGKGSRIVGPLRSGDRCIMIEDVVTTGGSTIDAINVVESIGAKVIAVYCVVDRLQGGAEKFEALGIPFRPLCTIKDLGIE